MPAIEYIDVVNAAGRVTTVPRGQMRVLESKGWREATDDDKERWAKTKAEHAGTLNEVTEPATPSWTTPSEED